MEGSRRYFSEVVAEIVQLVATRSGVYSRPRQRDWWSTDLRRRTHGLETRGAQGIPEERRCIGRGVHLGSRRTRDRPDTRIAAHEKGRQGSDRLRRPLAVRHVRTYRAPRGRKAFTRWLRPGLSRGIADPGFGGGEIGRASCRERVGG